MSRIDILKLVGYLESKLHVAEREMIPISKVTLSLNDVALLAKSSYCSWIETTVEMDRDYLHHCIKYLDNYLDKTKPYEGN